MLKAYEVVSKRKLVGGPSDSYRGINPLKYPWAREIWTQMLANTWFPTEQDLTKDIGMYKDLTDGNKLAYDRGLSFLASLDNIQLNNLALNILPLITAPEVRECLNRQVFEEQLHVKSYSEMIETIALDPEAIYFMPLEDKILDAKNSHITAQASFLKDDTSVRTLLLAFISNIILEGIYFYSGFATFYTLARSGTMIGSANMVKFIQRDEEVHLKLFVNMVKVLEMENNLTCNDFKADIHALMDDSVNLEIAWGKHIIEGGVLGLTGGIIEDYIRYLADDRLSMIGMEKMYNVKNPLSWITDFSKINGEDASFFEKRPIDYTRGSFAW